MPIDSTTQAEFVRDVENVRQQVRGAVVNITNQTTGQVRNALVQRQLLDAKVASAEFAGAYGDGSAGTVAAEIAAEVKAANAAVDAVIGITGKTRAQVEAELTPQFPQ